MAKILKILRRTSQKINKRVYIWINQKDQNYARQKFQNIFVKLTFRGADGTQNEEEGNGQIGCFVAHGGHTGRSRQVDQASNHFKVKKSQK